MTDERAPKVGYLVTLFPKLSESFVLNEVVQLQRRGMEIVPVCLDRSGRVEERVHAAAGEMRHRVIYALDAFPREHLRAIAYWSARRPGALLRLFVRNATHPAPRGESKLGRFSIAAYTAWLARTHGLSHVHAHWSYPADVALLLERCFGIPFSFTVHAHDIFEDVDLYEASGFAFAERVRRAAFVVTCTEFNRRHVERLCDPADRHKVHHAYHGLDPAFFSRAAPPPEGRGEVVILSVGRFVPYKGFDVIVRACAELAAHGRSFRCLVVGPEGSQTPVVRDLIRRAGLEGRVEMLGPRTQEELLELYRCADIYVNASNPNGEYGVANVIVEALAMGLPTVATHRPQVAEYIEDGLNGLLVPYGDHSALARAVERLMDDDSLRERLSGAGRELVVARFDISRTADKLLGLFAAAARSGAPETASGSGAHQS